MKIFFAAAGLSAALLVAFGDLAQAQTQTPTQPELPGASATGAPSATGAATATHSNRFFRKQSAEDKQLTRSVRRAIAKLKGVNVADVLVAARDGIVRLTGTAMDADQMQRIVAAVGASPGVQSVVNALTIRARM